MNDNETLAKVRRVSDILLETLEAAAQATTPETLNETLNNITAMAYALKECLELEDKLSV